MILLEIGPRLFAALLIIGLVLGLLAIVREGRRR